MSTRFPIHGVLLLGGITAILFASSAIAVTQDVVHPGLRATSYSLCVISMNLLGKDDRVAFFDVEVHGVLGIDLHVTRW